MKRVIPFAIIAVLGIVAVVIISIIGLDNRAEIAEGDNGDNTEQTENGGTDEGATAEVDADEVFQTNCAMCHGADLASGTAPDLTEVGSRLSEDEIKDIIQNGRGAMPPIGDVQGEELDALATWLSEEHN